VRLIDTFFRRGHLSEQALFDAIVLGERPLHLDRCDICADRAVELARWMDEVKADGLEAADELDTPERLAAQQGQIMPRLEQLDNPARVIAFPAGSRPEAPGFGRRRVAVSWVGVAAAAGLLVGVVSGQLAARLGQPAVVPITANADAALVEGAGGAVDPSLFADPFESVNVSSLEVLNDLTPRLPAVRSGG